jgi:hypothetical protein
MRFAENKLLLPKIKFYLIRLLNMTNYILKSKKNISSTLVAIGFIITIILLIAPSCKRYKDPTPITTDKLTQHFCNNPKAVNYNWGFPGIADSTLCFFPADLFIGNYTYYDSLLDDANGIYLPFDTMDVTIAKINDSSIQLIGLCLATPFSAKATKNYRFTIDSTTAFGQVFCSNADTMNGTGIKVQFNDTNFVYNYQLVNNGKTTMHKGWLIKK